MTKKPRQTSLPESASIMNIVRAFAASLLMLFLCVPGQAQDRTGSPVTSEVSPPVSETSEQYRSLADGADIKHKATYAEKLSGTLSDERTIRETTNRDTRQPLFTPKLDGGIGVGIAIFLAIALLLLWLKFGGSGVLLSGDPKDVKEKQKAPDHWNIAAQESEMDGNDLLAHLAAMSDRREALARLLRHCLLSAGEQSDTRFARSDTERDAFARLPQAFRHHDELKILLRDAELAHYGGRTVSDEIFSRSLELGRVLLEKPGSHRHA